MRTNDKRFADAEHFMSCYFNQDWKEILIGENQPPTVDGSIAFAIHQNPPEALREMAESLQLVLRENLSEDELSELYFNQGAMAYDPRRAYADLRTFTEYVLNALRRSPKLSTKS